MKNLNQYGNKPEELKRIFSQQDSYTPNTNNFSLDISQFLDEKMKNIFDPRQRKLIAQMPTENVLRSEKLFLADLEHLKEKLDSKMYPTN